jgi:hypothetical protein
MSRVSRPHLLPLAALGTVALALAGLYLLVAVTGCDSAPHMIQVNTAPVPQAGQGLTPGERVVARFKETFREGTVITVQGRLVTLAWDDGAPERSYLPRGWVRSLDRRSAPIKQGQWALCRPKATGWELCRVDRVQGDQLQASLIDDGASWQIARRRSFALPAKLNAWAEERGTELLKLARRKTLLERSKPASAGQAVQTGQTVLAEWTKDSWWEAKVTRVQKDAISVTWVDGGAQVVQPSQVAPISGAAQLRSGDLAYCKWNSSTQWYQAWIERRSDASAQITYRDGNSGKVPLKSCLPASADG